MLGASFMKFVEFLSYDISYDRVTSSEDSFDKNSF